MYILLNYDYAKIKAARETIIRFVDGDDITVHVVAKVVRISGDRYAIYLKDGCFDKCCSLNLTKHRFERAE